MWRAIPLIIAGLIHTACGIGSDSPDPAENATVSGTPIPDSSPIQVFPQQAESDEEPEPNRVGNREFGNVVEEGGCLRLVIDGGAGNYPLIWPEDYRLDAEDSEVRVLEGSGQVVAEIGDRLRISGGTAASDS